MASLVSSSFFMLTFIAISLGLLFFASYFFVSWSDVLNVKSTIAIAEAGPTLVIAFSFFLLSLPLSIVRTVQNGLQQGFKFYTWSLAGAILSLGAQLTAVYLKAGLQYVVFAASAPIIVTTLLNGMIFFLGEHRDLRPRLAKISFSNMDKLLRVGLAFFSIQLSVCVGLRSDNMIISRILGASAVTQYTIPAKIFGLVANILSLIMTPLWPAYAESMSRGEIGWTRRALIRCVSIGLAFSLPVSILLFVFGRRLSGLWSGGEVNPSNLLLLGLTIYAVQNTLLASFSTVLNGCNAIRTQSFLYILMAFMNVTLSIFMTSRLGISGVIYGTIISELSMLILPFGLIIYFRLFHDKNLDTAYQSQLKY